MPPLCGATLCSRIYALPPCACRRPQRGSLSTRRALASRSPSKPWRRRRPSGMSPTVVLPHPAGPACSATVPWLHDDLVLLTGPPAAPTVVRDGGHDGCSRGRRCASLLSYKSSPTVEHLCRLSSRNSTVAAWMIRDDCEIHGWRGPREPPIRNSQTEAVLVLQAPSCAGTARLREFATLCL
jgi:hypothetical protein